MAVSGHKEPRQRALRLADVHQLDQAGLEGMVSTRPALRRARGGKPAFALMAERGTGHYVGSAFITLNRELRVQEAGHFSGQLKSQ